MSKKNYSSGIGFRGLLTIVFIALKLMKYIDWSWLWVLSPTWIPLAVILILGIIAGGLFAIARILGKV